MLARFDNLEEKTKFVKEIEKEANECNVLLSPILIQKFGFKSKQNMKQWLTRYCYIKIEKKYTLILKEKLK